MRATAWLARRRKCEAALDTELRRAEQQVGQQNCDAVASLDQYAARLGAADGSAAVQRLQEQGEQLRFDILASVPANDGCKGDIKVSVDKKIKPSVTTAPGYQRGTARPVAAVRAATARRRTSSPTSWC